MKKFIYFGIIGLAVIFSACQKEYNPFEEESSFTGSFRAKINGVQWEANSIKTATRQAGVLALYGTSSDKKALLLRVADSGVHNYTFYSESASNVAVLTDSSEANTNAYTTNQFDTAGVYGNLNVTSIDTVNKTISGTFSFRVYRMMDSAQKTITEGVFTNISYSTSPPAPSGTDSFRVKIDGTPFTYNMLTGFKGFGMLSVSASTGAAPTVGISMPDTVRVGTYPLSDFDYIGQYNPTSSTFLSADTGSVTILEHNTVTKRIRGNFHFLANTVFTHQPPNHQLTEGYFSVKYN